MSETITTGPTIPEEWALWAQGRLAGLADQVRHVGPPTLLDPWDAAVYASVVEVLGDPARWARALGIESPILAPVEAKDENEDNFRHPWLTWTKTRY